MKRVYCYGDSNTYGYDPRNFGGRYPAGERWPDLLRGYESQNNGMNGREIPKRNGVFPTNYDIYVILLGTNDMLQGATALETARRMERFLSELNVPPSKILLIAPPPMKPGAWIDHRELLTESAALGECYRTLAQMLGVSFADAADWKVELCFDGVHFTETGHKAFAEHLQAVLDDFF